MGYINLGATLPGFNGHSLRATTQGCCCLRFWRPLEHLSDSGHENAAAQGTVCVSLVYEYILEQRPGKFRRRVADGPGRGPSRSHRSPSAASSCSKRWCVVGLREPAGCETWAGSTGGAECTAPFRRDSNSCKVELCRVVGGWLDGWNRVLPTILHPKPLGGRQRSTWKPRQMGWSCVWAQLGGVRV